MSTEQSYYAMVIVVAAEDEEKAWEMTVDPNGRVLAEAEFVGEPWRVQPLEGYEDAGVEAMRDPQFGTIECIEQHPEAPKR